MRKAGSEFKIVMGRRKETRGRTGTTYETPKGGGRGWDTAVVILAGACGGLPREGHLVGGLTRKGPF